MVLSQLERLIISAQLIQIHEERLHPQETELIDHVETLVVNKTTNIEYSIALVRARNIQEIYVIIPGSNDKADWLANFQIRLSRMVYKVAKSIDPIQDYGKAIDSHDTIEDIGMVIPHANKEGCEAWSDQRVHSGFMRAYYQIEEQAIADLKDVLEAHPTHSVVGTAHSLGSAILRFMMLDAVYKGLFENRKAPALYTYGAPRMGNQKFCNALIDYLPHITRVVNGVDLVTRLPLPVIGYRHETKQHYIGKRQWLRWYYKQDITDHFIEAYLSQLQHLRGFIAQDAKTPSIDLERGSALS
ncbi:MAG: lipase family protein [Chloroflexota bacterium]